MGKPDFVYVNNTRGYVCLSCLMGWLKAKAEAGVQYPHPGRAFKDDPRCQECGKRVSLSVEDTDEDIPDDTSTGDVSLSDYIE